MPPTKNGQSSMTRSWGLSWEGKDNVGRLIHKQKYLYENSAKRWIFQGTFPSIYALNDRCLPCFFFLFSVLPFQITPKYVSICLFALLFKTSLSPSSFYINKRYQSMTGEIGGIYDKAKAGHESGLKILMSEFGYHPEFKRPGDSFSAVPFRPKDLA